MKLDWRKVWVVARHEYLTNVRRTGFIIMTAIVPTLGLIALLVGALLAPQARQIGESIASFFDTGGKRIGLVDHSGEFTPVLPEYEDTFTVFASDEEAEAAVDADEVEIVLVVPEDYLETGRVIVLTKGSGFDAAVVEDSPTIHAFFVDHLLDGKVDPELRARLIDPIEPELRMLGGKEGVSGGWGVVFGFFIPYFLAVFLVMTIFTSSGYLLQGVAEEKESRVIEIVVSSVRPIELMAGKVIGLGALGLTQVGVWLGSVWLLSGGAAALLAVAATLVAPRVFLLAAVYYVLGFLLYAVLMAGVGALGTTMRESQQLAGIFSMFAMIPYMLSGLLFANPNVGLARALSYFPLTAPTMMMMRLPLADVPTIDIVVSILVLLASIPAALWFGGRLFEIGLLIYGKRPTMREVWAILRGSRTVARS
ncbi:MAG TPA: ABC transporter permease [Thermoflexia bacterium]|jgi:ABC-2 type transport system permease protein|nr:ABC transporter permease [Thermoflexia bacterium]